MVDTGGSTFLFRLGEETGMEVPDITRAWLVAGQVFGMRAFWQQVEALAGSVEVGARIAVVLEARKLVERAKGVLMDSQNLKEAEAFRRIQRLSMNSRKSMREVAEAILLAHEAGRSL